MRRTGFSREATRVAASAHHSAGAARGRRPSFAPSARSTASLATSDNRTVGRTATAAPDAADRQPLELYEYGDPLAEFEAPVRVINFEERDEPHLRLLTKETLDLIRRTERVATKTLIHTAASLVPINGAKVLLLASGRGTAVSTIAKMGPAELTVVDCNPDVISDAVALVRQIGQSSSVSLFPVVADAREFCADTDDTYDLIICVHSIGQILKDGGDIEDFSTSVASILAPGGIMILDEHMGFTDVDSPPPVCVGDATDRYVATGLGGFRSDVNYLLPRAIPGCIRRSEWITPGKPHPMQRWFYIAWEKRDDSLVGVVPPAPVAYTTLGRLPSCGPVDSPVLFELSYPRAARGVKIPVGREDRRVVSPGRLMPKINGEAAVLVLYDDVAVFTGPTLGGTFFLPIVFDVPLMCTAEVVLSSAGDYLLFVTGVLDRGGRPVDPASNAALRTLDKCQQQLMAVGIIINTPSLVPHIRNDTLFIPGSPAGRTVPVDGLNMMCGGRWNRFFKPMSTLSVDVTLSAWADLTDQASETTSLLRPFGDKFVPALPQRPADSVVGAQQGAEEMVYEVGIMMDGTRPKPVFLRKRRDKDRPDGLGKFLVFLSSVRRVSPFSAEIATTSRLLGYLSTG